MKTLSQYLPETVTLDQPSIWKRVYELRTETDLLLTMSYPKWYGTDAVVTGFGETWELRKPSIWKSSLEIFKQGNQLPFAKFTAEKWGRGGTFELPNGERIHYVFGIWKSTNELLTPQKIKLVSFKRKSIWKSAITVTIEKESTLLDKHPWMIMATYYQMMARRQSAHAAAG